MATNGTRLDTNETGSEPRASRDFRPLIPKLGLKEYWYPAIADSKVGKTPVYLKMLGENLALFRGRSGKVVALADACPHRGAMLSHGDCRFPGFITCFYHGFTFDENGECVAALGEGPESPMPGKVRARVYPTVTLKGFVFVWMGAGEPVSPEEDIPEEFFDDRTLVFNWSNVWDCNWRPALENYADSHFRVLHENAVRILMRRLPGAGGGQGSRPTVVGKHRLRAFSDDGPAGGSSTRRIAAAKRPYQDHYPKVGAKWPKSRWRLLWSPIFDWGERRRTKRSFKVSEEWLPGQHLPGMVRQNYWTHMFTRWVVPMEENKSRLVYFHAARPNNWLGRVYERLHWTFIHNWLVNKNFSEQDARGAIEAYHDTPEYLAPSDAQTIAWRRFILDARGLSGSSEASEEAAGEEQRAREEASPAPAR